LSQINAAGRRRRRLCAFIPEAAAMRARSLALVSVLALALTAPLAAEAQMRHGQRQGNDCEPGMGMMCMTGHRMQMREQWLERRMERHLTGLKEDLKITEAQTKAWDEYTAAVKAAATAMVEQRKAMRDKMDSATFPQRLDLHEAMLVSHVEQLRKTKSAANALYAQLTDAQKKVADVEAMGMVRMRPGRRHH
jgi:hypothetical protein